MRPAPVELVDAEAVRFLARAPQLDRVVEVRLAGLELLDDLLQLSPEPLRSSSRLLDEYVEAALAKKLDVDACSCRQLGTTTIRPPVSRDRVPAFQGRSGRAR